MLQILRKKKEPAPGTQALAWLAAAAAVPATFFGFTVISASGKVKLPTDSQVTIKAKQSSDSLIEIGVTQVGGQTWITASAKGTSISTT